MKERPILMNTPMVRAILGGIKTQTRRPVRPMKHPYGHWLSVDDVVSEWTGGTGAVSCPLGTVGDRLWVRETWAWYGCEYLRDEVLYRADGAELPADFEYWRPSVHMPRWASRITLEITDVRIERLCKISEADVIAEGLKAISKDGGRTYKYGVPDFEGYPGEGGWRWAEWKICPRAAFKKLWESTYGPNSYDDKWVWVIEFRRVDEQSTKSK